MSEVSGSVAITEDEEERRLNDEILSKLMAFEKMNLVVTESRMQMELDHMIEEMKSVKEALCTNLDIIEKIDLMIDSYTYNQYECTHNYTKRIDAIKTHQTALLSSNLSRTEIVLQLAEIDELLVQIKEHYEKKSTKLNEDKLEMQNKYEKAAQLLDQALESLTTYYDKLLVSLEDQKINSTESEIDLLDTTYADVINQFKDSIDQYKGLQLTGWRSIHSEEKIAGLLEARGLKFTKSGHIMSRKGELFTMKEAYNRGLLEGLDIDWTRFLSKHIIPTDLGGASTESSSVCSKLSSEDVGYLKRSVGKPLTLALAEITAKQPKDPIHYLAHWLFKYRYNNEIKEIDEQEVRKLNAERERLAKEKWQQFLEDEAKATVWEMIITAENMAIQNELTRIEREAMLEEEYEEDLDDEARDQLGVYGGPPVRTSLN